MAVKNRKSGSSENISKNKSKNGTTRSEKAQKDMSNTSLATNKFAGLLGLFILFFAVVYAIVMGTYIFKRGTGKTTSALKHNGPFAGSNIDMETLRNPVVPNESEKRAFSEEDVEKLKEVFVDVNGNAQVPPNDEENNKEDGNDNGKEGSNEEKKQRQKRSIAMESGNAPDETGEMSDYLRNLLTRGPSANFVDLLRNKIVILNPLDDSIVQPTSFTSTHVRHRRSINQHMYASGISK